MKKHKYLFVACLSLFPVMAVAGNDTLHEIMEVPSATNINKNRLYKGKVVDDRTSEPLVGATVKVKGSTIGTITDIDGNFALDIPDNISPIVFEVSYMGYASKEAAPAKTTGYDSDAKVADMLRRSRKPVILAVNKVDNFDKLMPDVYEFYNLGIGDPHPISAASKLGLGDMLDAVISHFPEDSAEEEEDERPKVAIIGKPNVGKSSIINKLMGKNRVIVSDIAGTTRDAIDTTITYNKKEYVFIDTAGLRRKSKIKEELERYSIIRTVAAVERCDIAILVIDATEGVTEQDAKIAGIAHERGKGIIIAVNKWDAIEKNDKTIYEFTSKIKDTLAFMSYAEIIFISALTGQRIGKIYELIDTIIDSQTMRIPTGVLNEILTEAVAMKQPPSDKGKRLRIYYMTQVSVKPPTFVMFVNDKELTHFSYTRYIENRIRESFGFRGTSIRFINRERKEKE